MRSATAMAVLIGLGTTAPAAGDFKIEGKWMRGDGNALVRIAPCGSKTCVTNLWIGDTSKGERVGDQLLMSLTRGRQTLSPVPPMIRNAS